MRLGLAFCVVFWVSLAFGVHAVLSQTEPPEPVFSCDFVDSDTPGLASQYAGTQFNDCYSALDKSDVAVGFGGKDRLEMGDGDDQACGDNCSAGGVQDILRGGRGGDLLIGDGGNDFIYLGDGNDEGRGGDGNDTIAACDGQIDTVKGGSGFNTAYLDREKDIWSNIDVKHFC